MKISLLLALQMLCLLASCQPPRTAPAQVPATTTVSTLPTHPSWVIKRADDTDTGDDDSGDSDDAADAATADDSTDTAAETTAEETAEETTAEQTTAEETTASETSSAETTSETSSETTTSSSSTSSSSTSTSSSSSSSTSSSSSPTSTVSPEQAQRNHVGNIAAIATFSALGFIILVVVLALAIRKRVLAKRKEDQKALLQAGSSAYSMVPAAAENPSANASEVRLSMMFANEPRVQEQQTVHASPPFLSPEQGQQQVRGSRLSQQYPAYI